MITLQEALNWMQSGKPFSCKVVSYDRTRHTGGTILEYPEAVQLLPSGQSPPSGDLGGLGVRGRTRTEQLRSQLYEQASRKPQHGKHFTRNIQLLQDGHPVVIVKKIHPVLLLEFNGQEVFL
jgi:hypothetical protein